MRSSPLQQTVTTRPAAGVLESQGQVAMISTPLKATRRETRASTETSTSTNSSHVSSSGSSSRSEYSKHHQAVIATPQSSDTGSEQSHASNKSDHRRSLYNGPQLAEPCVADALVHVLKPCEHKVLTGQPTLCGANCLGSGSEYANERSADRFICAVCVSRSVKEHYCARRSLFITSLDRLERSIGGFETSWKQKRLARMEEVCKAEAIQELTDLSGLGRHCMAVSINDDVEFSLTTDLAFTWTGHVDYKGSCPAQPDQPQRQKSPSVAMKTSIKASRLPMPASKAKHVEQKPAIVATSRLPVYRRR